MQGDGECIKSVGTISLNFDLSIKAVVERNVILAMHAVYHDS
jgi:hypothetical protein